MVIEDLAAVLEMNGVEVRLGETATAEGLAAASPDAVVCATGSTWDRTGFSAARPDRETMPGAGGDHVLDVATATLAALDDPEALGAKVLILDDTGTYLPLGLAEVLGEGGVEVEVLSRFPVIGELVAGTQDLPWLLPRLARLDVRLSPNHFIESIDGRAGFTSTRPSPGRHAARRRCRHGRALDDAHPAGRPVPSSCGKPAPFLSTALATPSPPRSVAEAIYEGRRNSAAPYRLADGSKRCVQSLRIARFAGR